MGFTVRPTGDVELDRVQRDIAAALNKLQLNVTQTIQQVVATIFTPLAPTGVTAGPYTNADITVDVFGRVTSAANGAAGADSLGSYLVASSVDAPVNAIDLGALATGVLQQTVTSGVAVIDVKTLPAGGVVYGGGDGRLQANAFNLSYDSFLHVLTAAKIDVGTLRPTGLSGTGFVLHDGATHNLSIDATTYTPSGSAFSYLQQGVGIYSAFGYGAKLELATTFALTLNAGTSIGIDLAASGVTAGTYTNATISVDAKGRVTAAANGSGGGGGITALTGDVTASGSGSVAATIVKVGALTSNGFVKTTGGTGTLAVDTTSYQPALSLTTKDVLYATGAGTVGQDSAFQYTTGTKTLAVPNIVSNDPGGLSLGASGGIGIVDQTGDIALIPGAAGGVGAGILLSATGTYTLTQLASGLVKSTGGVLSVDTNTYLTTSGAAATYETISHASSTYLAKANNLSDVASAATSRTNLGLATIAVSASASDLTAGTLPAARFPALTGDLTTSAGALATTLAASGVTAGTYTNATISVDAKGRVTSATTGSGGTGISQLTGDVTAGPGSGSQAATIAAAAVTYAKIQNVTAARILGNVSGSAAPVAEVTASALATFLSLATIATSASASDLTTGTLPAGRFPALTGDVTTSAGSLATTLASTAVAAGSYTYASLTVDAKGRLTAASSGAAPEVPLTFSTGLARSTNTITATLSTGKSGGQSVIGGTAVGNDLTLSSTSSTTKGRIIFGTTTKGFISESTGDMFVGGVLNIIGTIQGYGGGGSAQFLNSSSDDAHLSLSSSGVEVKGDTYPLTTGTYNLGSSAHAWASIYGGTVNGLTFQGFGGGAATQILNASSDDAHLALSTSGVEVKGNMYPLGLLSNLGSSSAPWSHTYSLYLHSDVIFSLSSGGAGPISMGAIITGPSTIGFLGSGASPQQTGGAFTFGATYTSAEQAKLQVLWNAMRLYGLLS